MTEDEARQWVQARDVPRGTIESIDHFVTLLRAEAGRQNLIAASTLDQLWSRHIVDSAQLIELAPGGEWLDVGTGAGFPGLVVALLTERRCLLVEPRSRRAAFLQECVTVLGLDGRVAVAAAKAERLPPAGYPIVSARAVATLADLFTAARHLAAPDAIWLLPKGRRAAQELAEARRWWQGDFRLVPSITDPTAAIIVARNVLPRSSR